MPVLLQRGCALETCHSPNGFNDFRLRPGVGRVPLAAGPAPQLRGRAARVHGARHARRAPVAPGEEEPRSRQTGGITHRGGAAAGGTRPRQPRPLPARRSTPPPPPRFCTIDGVAPPRARRITPPRSSPLAAGSVVPLAFVARPADRRRRRSSSTPSAAAPTCGWPTPPRRRRPRRAVDQRPQRARPLRRAWPAAPTSTCAAPSGATTAASWCSPPAQGDGGGLDLWLLDAGAPARCRAPDQRQRPAGRARCGCTTSTRCSRPTAAWCSPRPARGTLTLKRLLPNADLYRVGPDLDFGSAEHDDRAARAASWRRRSCRTASSPSPPRRRRPSFYQLSGRRINWDLTDYHPLLAQRAQSDDTFGNDRARRSATSRRPRSARGWTATSCSSCRTPAPGAAAARWRSSTARSGPFEEGRGEVTFLRALVHRSTRRPPAAPARRASTARRSRCPTARSWRRTRPTSTDPAARRAPLRSGRRSTPAAARRRMLLAGGDLSLVEASAGLQARRRGCCSATCPSWCSAAAPAADGDGDRALPRSAHAGHAAGRQPAPRAATSPPSTAPASWRSTTSAAPPSATPDPVALMGSERVFTQRQLLGVGAARVGRLAEGGCCPPRKPLIFELQDGGRKPIFTMREEHQLGPGETHLAGRAAQAVRRRLRRLPRLAQRHASPTSPSPPTRSPARRGRCPATSPPRRLQVTTPEHTPEPGSCLDGSDSGGKNERVVRVVRLAFACHACSVCFVPEPGGRAGGAGPRPNRRRSPLAEPARARPTPGRCRSTASSARASSRPPTTTTWRNPKRGSFEFAEVGINFTKALSDRLRLGVQLFARDLGPIGNYDAKFDWFYLDYRLSDWLGLRAGRVKLPFGLYNEINDVDAARVPILLPQSVYSTRNRDYPAGPDRGRAVRLPADGRRPGRSTTGCTAGPSSSTIPARPPA